MVAPELYPADKGDTKAIKGTLVSAESQLLDADGPLLSEVPAERVAEKGYHSRAVLQNLDGSHWTFRLAEPRRTAFSRWHWEEEARRAVYNNRGCLRSSIGKEVMRKQAEIVEQPVPHNLDLGGMRRTWLHSRENIHKRFLIHVTKHNLELLIRFLAGAGTATEAVARVWFFFLVLVPRGWASNTALFLNWLLSASDPDAIECVITENQETG